MMGRVSDRRRSFCRGLLSHLPLLTVAVPFVAGYYPTSSPTPQVVFADSQAAVANALADHAIIKLSSIISLSSTLTISGVSFATIDGQGSYGFDGGSAQKLLYITDVTKLLLKDLTFANGQDTDGGCVRANDGSVTFLRASFTSCKANKGVRGGDRKRLSIFLWIIYSPTTFT
jgi:hypothetical protein